jgi:hypothetical protein
MLNYYTGTEDVCFSNIKSAEDVYEVIDAMHSKAMEDCGAIDDINKTSEALEICEKLLELVGYKCEDIAIIEKDSK